MRPPLLASHAHGAPHSHSCRHSGSELGLLGLSRWLICLFAAPWQEGAGEAGESSGLKEGGKWPVWLPAARRHPKYKNHEEGEAGTGKRRESLARGRGTWEKEETGGGNGSSSPGHSQPPKCKGGAWFPRPAPRLTYIPTAPDQGATGPREGPPQPTPTLATPTAPRPPLRALPGDTRCPQQTLSRSPGDNALVCFLESSGVWPGRGHQEEKRPNSPCSTCTQALLLPGQRVSPPSDKQWL